VANIEQARKGVLTRILEGEGGAAPAQRRAAFDNAGVPEPLRTLVEKVAKKAHRVTDDDVAAARAAGLSEDQIFEIVICAAIGEANRQYEQAMVAVEAVTGKE
jgi:hypothetical protein